MTYDNALKSAKQNLRMILCFSHDEYEAIINYHQFPIWRSVSKWPIRLCSIATGRMNKIAIELAQNSVAKAPKDVAELFSATKGGV